MTHGQEAEQPQDHAQHHELEHGIPPRAHPASARAASHLLAQFSETSDPGKQQGRHPDPEMQVEHPEVGTKHQANQGEAQKHEPEYRSQKTHPYLQRNDSIAVRMTVSRKVTTIA